MNYLVRGIEEDFAASSLLVLKKAAAIAFGIILITSLTEILRKVQGYWYQHRKTSRNDEAYLVYLAGICCRQNKKVSSRIKRRVSQYISQYSFDG